MFEEIQPLIRWWVKNELPPFPPGVTEHQSILTNEQLRKIVLRILEIPQCTIAPSTLAKIMPILHRRLTNNDCLLIFQKALGIYTSTIEDECSGTNFFKIIFSDSVELRLDAGLHQALARFFPVINSHGSFKEDSERMIHFKDITSAEFVCLLEELFGYLPNFLPQNLHTSPSERPDYLRLLEIANQLGSDLVAQKVAAAWENGFDPHNGEHIQALAFALDGRFSPEIEPYLRRCLDRVMLPLFQGVASPLKQKWVLEQLGRFVTKIEITSSSNLPLLSQLPNLNRIVFNNIHDNFGLIWESFLKMEACLPKLQAVSLEHCSALKNEHLMAMTTCFPLLQRVKIWDCTNLTEEGFEALLKLKQLSHLELKWIKLDLSTFIEKTLNKANALENLRLNRCKLLSAFDADPQNRSHSLKIISLIDCTAPKTTSLIALLKRCPKLKKLDFDGIIPGKKEPTPLIESFFNFKDMTEITTDSFSSQQHISFRAADIKCTKLATLTINSLWRFSVETTESTLFPSLTYLRLRYFSHVLDIKELIKLIRNCPNLKFLDLNYCSEEDLEVLKVEFPELTILMPDKTHIKKR